MNKRTVGTSHEKRAGAYLEQNGVEIYAYNYSARYGEIDIIGRDKDDLVFFEVKYRSTDAKGYAAEAVDRRKQYKICRVSDLYMLKNRISPDTQVRYDVIAMDESETQWIKNAFEYIPNGN